MNAVWADSFDDEDDDEATSKRPSAMLEAMVRTIQNDLGFEPRAHEPPQSARMLRTPLTLPRISRPPPLPRNPFLEPATADDPPAPWEETRVRHLVRGKVAETDALTRKSSRPVLKVALLLLGLAIGLLVSSFWRHPKADAAARQALSFFELSATAPTTVTEVRVETPAKVIRDTETAPVSRKKSAP